MRSIAPIAAVILFLPSWTWASNCGVTSVGFTPLIDLGSDRYLNMYEGGLYPNGSNTMPPDHAFLGGLAANCVEPLDRNGEPAENGRIVLMSIGMSNANDHFFGFIDAVAANPDANRSSLRLVNAATSGQTAENWVTPDAPIYELIRMSTLRDAGLTEAQVQAIWLLQANGFPTESLPNPDADAFILLEELGDIARALKIRYPNLQMVFLTSRMYAGYASTELNPEPYAYESGFSVKWLIEAQINQRQNGVIDPIAGDLAVPAAAPWLAWAPYIWADGLTPRSDGLIWECNDLREDGTHPSASGTAKVGAMMLDFFLNSEFTADWFRAGGCPKDGDVNDDGAASPIDALWVFEAFLGTKQLDPCAVARGDLDDEAGLTPRDAGLVFQRFVDGEDG